MKHHKNKYIHFRSGFFHSHIVERSTSLGTTISGKIHISVVKYYSYSCIRTIVFLTLVIWHSKAFSVSESFYQSLNNMKLTFYMQLAIDGQRRGY
jgi:hypothetical protein